MKTQRVRTDDGSFSVFKGLLTFFFVFRMAAEIVIVPRKARFNFKTLCIFTTRSGHIGYRIAKFGEVPALIE